MIAFLAIGCAGFAAVLVCGPYLIIRAHYGPVHDPEHIAALRYAAQPSRETERNASPDDATNKARVGNRGEIIVDHGASE